MLSSTRPPDSEGAMTCMNDRLTTTTLSRGRLEMRRVLRAAYPDGVPPEEYEAARLHPEPTRCHSASVAHLLEDCGIRDYYRRLQRRSRHR